VVTHKVTVTDLPHDADAGVLFQVYYPAFIIRLSPGGKKNAYPRGEGVSFIDGNNLGDFSGI